MQRRLKTRKQYSSDCTRRYAGVQLNDTVTCYQTRLHMQNNVRRTDRQTNGMDGIIQQANVAVDYLALVAP